MSVFTPVISTHDSTNEGHISHKSVVFGCKEKIWFFAWGEINVSFSQKKTGKWTLIFCVEIRFLCSGGKNNLGCWFKPRWVKPNNHGPYFTQTQRKLKLTKLHSHSACPHVSLITSDSVNPAETNCCYKYCSCGLKWCWFCLWTVAAGGTPQTEQTNTAARLSMRSSLAGKTSQSLKSC